jgi:hypothetical protein
LETAIQIGLLTGTDVAAVHIRRHARESIETPKLLAARLKVPLRVFESSVKPTLLGALGAPDVTVAVEGVRAISEGEQPGACQPF